jgi:hypothetical protein
MFDYLLITDTFFRCGDDEIELNDLLRGILFPLLSYDFDLEWFDLFRVELRSLVLGVLNDDYCDLLFVFIAIVDKGKRSVLFKDFCGYSINIFESITRVTYLIYFFFYMCLFTFPKSFINNDNKQYLI